MQEGDLPLGSISYKESLKGPLAPYWQQARNKEFDNWMRLDVAEVTDLPEGERAIPGHWIFNFMFILYLCYFTFHNLRRRHPILIPILLQNHLITKK